MRVEPAKTTAMDLAQMYRRLLYPDQHERPLRFCGRCKTGQVQDRADRYRAAGLTPEEAARMELDGTVDWDALAHLAALRGHRLGSIRPDALLTA